MTKPNQPSRHMWAGRWLIAGALALGLSAGPLLMTYAATGEAVGTPTPAGTVIPVTGTAKPVSTAKPAASTTPAAAANPPVLAATYDTRTFTCDPSLCDHSNITLYIPNAPDTTWVGVQWLDSTFWKDVDGWQGNLDIAPNSHQPFKQWLVSHANFGQGPFRWVISAYQGGPVVGISPEFNLPAVGGLNVLTFLTLPASTMIGATPLPIPQGTGNTAGVPTLTANSTISGFSCSDSPCAASNIQVFVPNAPAAAWVGVQWLDANGIWHNVPGWQGNLDMNSTLNTNTPFKQWAVFGSQLLGQGPFRWVIYAQKGGPVWGISPSFNLPLGGQMMTTFLSTSPAG